MASSRSDLQGYSLGAGHLLRCTIQVRKMTRPFLKLATFLCLHNDLWMEDKQIQHKTIISAMSIVSVEPTTATSTIIFLCLLQNVRSIFHTYKKLFRMYEARPIPGMHVIELQAYLESGKTSVLLPGASVGRTGYPPVAPMTHVFVERDI